MSTTEMYGPHGNAIQREIDAKHEALQKYRNQVIAQRNAVKASVGNAPNNTFKKVFNKKRGFFTRKSRKSLKSRKSRKSRKSTRKSRK